MTWSAGDRIDANLVAQAFKLDGKKDLFKRADATPLAGQARIGCGTLIVVLLVLMVLAVILSNCTSRCDPRYENCAGRNSGGSYGGFSTGGGHK